MPEISFHTTFSNSQFLLSRVKNGSESGLRDAESYRFGFNGKEKVDELFESSGSAYDFGARLYDSRLGIFLSIDPRTKDFPFFSPYLYAADNPIRFIDVNGEGPGDPPFTINCVYFVKLKNPTAKIVYNSGLGTFTNRVSGLYDNSNTDDYTVNLQQYYYSDFFSGAVRAISSTWGSNTYITMGQNVQDGQVTGDGTDNTRGYLAQDKNGKWYGGMGNPPADAKVAFGGGIPVIVGGQKYAEEKSDEYLESKGYGLQNHPNVGKVIIGINTTDNSMVLVVSPDELEYGGLTLDVIRNGLAERGYDYVFSFDGGSSSTLIQDGNNELVSPSWYKDNTIPVGVTFSSGE